MKIIDLIQTQLSIGRMHDLENLKSLFFFKMAFLFVFISLSGCSAFQKGIWYNSIDELINNNQYQQAIDQANNQLPVDKVLVKNIERQANIYRRQQIKQINLLLEQKQWAKARERLFVIQSNLPDHRQFQRTQERLNPLRKLERLALTLPEELAQA